MREDMEVLCERVASLLSKNPKLKDFESTSTPDDYIEDQVISGCNSAINRDAGSLSEGIHPGTHVLTRRINDIGKRLKILEKQLRAVLDQSTHAPESRNQLSAAVEELRRLSEELQNVHETEKSKAAPYAAAASTYNRRLIEASLDPLVTIDADGKVTDVNVATEKVTGFPRNELIGTDFSDYFTEPDKARAGFQQVFREGSVQNYALEIRHRDGHQTPVLYNATVYKNDAGVVQGVFAAARDITERKQAEEEKNTLRAQFRQAQKMEAVGMLAGGVAHDFNNLLTVINGESEFLLNDLAPDDPRREDLEQIMQAGHRAASLTSQLLAFSRKQILHPIILDLNHIVSEASKMLRRLIGEDIDLIFVPKPDLGLINADPGQIQQIIMNLSVNARDAMTKGGKLTIETANIENVDDQVRRRAAGSSGPYVMLAISDNGIGMDAETQTHIFEPFFTTKGPGKGTGLGLSTVYGIVKQSGGFIWTYSEPGEGTTFKIYFPRVAGKADKVADRDKREVELRGVETILLVEDDASVRAFAARALRRQGYSVLEASNGEEALHTAQEFVGEIHLILTDMVMPEMSGNKLIFQIKAARPGIKALFVSGYTSDAMVHHGVLDSSASFLQKPFTADDLAHKVREVIDSAGNH